MPLPNFIIPGVMKGGTSSLARALGAHPQIFIPREETHFFNVDERYERGLRYYETFFSARMNKPIIGEKTPTYSYQENVAGRIAASLPQVKLIWIFREPVARAYSHYWFFVSMGKERLSFEKALTREMQGATKDFTMRYRDRSIYITQVERYLKFFSKENMIFLKSNDLAKNQQAALARACQFLGADPSFQFPEQQVKENVTTMPKSVILQWLAYQLFNKKGVRVLRWMKKVNRKAVTGYPQISAETRRELQAFFQAYNAQLAELTGLDIADWADKD